MLESMLKQHFGYDTFRPGQKEIISSLLEGKDCIALLPTGMGKSLCYQLPGYLLPHPVLVISPLLSLMQDQVDQLKMRGEKRVIALNSFLSMREKQDVLSFLSHYRFIFTSPEMLMQPQVRHAIEQMTFSLIVADEAHCISQWGFDFRPDYLRIGEIQWKKPRPPVLALTATATGSVVQDIVQYLKMDAPYRFIHDVNRSNIKLAKVMFAQKEEKITWLLEHVSATAGPGIVYCSSRKKCEEISLKMLERGIVAASYHGGKDAEDRQFIQQQFLQGELEWIVATNAFGMGVHKENVRQVIHESMPANISNYMQEVGRAGRDGQQALAILLYADGDEHFAHYIATEDLPKQHHVEQFVYYIETGQQPEQMLQNAEISETGFRVLSYWLQQEPPSAVKQRLTKMMQEKDTEVGRMLALILQEHCMRERLVQYFGQNLSLQEGACCTNCGLRIKDFLLERQQGKTVNVEDWRKRLRKLLFGAP